MTNPVSGTTDANLSKGATFSLLSALFYASAVVFVRYDYQDGLTPGTAIFLRFAIASVALILYLTLARRWVKLSWSEARPLFLLGLLAYTILGVTWFVAVSIMPAWLASLFIALYPLSITLGSWLFYGEPINRQKALALMVVLVGAVALFWQPVEKVPVAGILLMLLNVVVNTLYILAGRRWTHDVPPAVSTVWITMGATLGALLYALLANQISFDFAPTAWVWVTLFAVISTALAIMFVWWAVGLIGPSRTAIIGSVEPVFAVLLAVTILGEQMSPLQILGATLVLAGALVVRIQPRRVLRRA